MPEFPDLPVVYLNAVQHKKKIKDASTSKDCQCRPELFLLQLHFVCKQQKVALTILLLNNIFILPQVF